MSLIYTMQYDETILEINEIILMSLVYTTQYDETILGINEMI